MDCGDGGALTDKEDIRAIEGLESAMFFLIGDARNVPPIGTIGWQDCYVRAGSIRLSKGREILEIVWNMRQIYLRTWKIRIWLVIIPTHRCHGLGSGHFVD